MNEDKLILRPKRVKGEDGYKTFSIRVREDLVERLDELATQTGRSRNELVNILLEFAAERCTIEHKESTQY